jgi:hypothetical protein
MFQAAVGNWHHSFGRPKLSLIRAGCPQYRDVGQAEVS